ncbi:serine protease, partial [Bacteroidales bacterium OttesenSCG-928-M06]|nr:serine protease [Bacteroidales bacterium OttesenSCG-928-M06]
MRKNRIAFLVAFLFLCITGSFAQISYGGKPLLMDNPLLRSSIEVPVITMPTFNLDSVLISDGLEDQSLRTSFPFAYKFFTNIQKGVDGIETLLPDGTRIWQVKIQSEGAYSLNLLFSEFDIPPGGKLFIYNIDHTHLIGAFDHRNNSPSGILPVQPIVGDAIIIEYSEPMNAPYKAKLVIGEVNHDYRNILDSPFLKREPGLDTTDYLCMPDALCEDVDNKNIRATVLLMIDGTTACSGVLINNTKQDGTPYLLTAVHCLNPKVIFPQEFDYYVDKAGTIITFFNYNRAVCGSTMKGSENMSTAITYPRVIIEEKDIALLELQEEPPFIYNAYYAGWNISDVADNPPYINLHHPSGAVKKFGITVNPLNLSSWSPTSDYPFKRNSHWRTTFWNAGATYAGSSGSPLFDADNRIVGGLTGGSSECNDTKSNNKSDLFFALYQGWENGNETNQLKTYLDPLGLNIKQLDGFDPNEKDPLFRLSNMLLNSTDTLETAIYQAPDKGYLFGNSNRKITEFAEKFVLDTTTVVHGVFLFIPAMPYASTSSVKISVYSGNEYPETLLASQDFTPKYLNYRTVGSDKDFIPDPLTTDQTPTEHFVPFDKPVYSGKKFFIAYQIDYSDKKQFVIYNTGSHLENPANTAWLKDEEGNWISSDNYSVQPKATSLALQPLVQYTDEVSIPILKEEKEKAFIYLNAENRLFIPEMETNGTLFIYSLDGRLIE